MKTYKKMLGLGMIVFAGCQLMAQSQSEQTIADVILAAPNLRTFAALLKKHNLLEKLNKEGPFTVFAPVDGAFYTYTLKYLPDWTVARILKHHIVKGAYTTENIPDEAQTLAHDTFYTYVVIHGAKKKVDFDFGETNIKAKNGFVNITHRILPPDFLRSFK